MEISSKMGPLCGHKAGVLARGHRLVCKECGSWWDAEYGSDEFEYDSRYPESRGHFSAETGDLKVKTLARWLSGLAIPYAEARVLEIGYGGGFCLRWLKEHTKQAYGVEADDSHKDHAVSLGIDTDHLFDARSLPDHLPEAIDLWLFQDSFEHVMEPERLVSWMLQNSSVNCRVLMVLPRAQAMTDLAMGKFWPHRLPDHRFHWSKAGVQEFFGSRGFRLADEFNPQKLIDTNMVAAHLAHKLAAPRLLGELAARVPRIRFPLNFGEMGLVFQRNS